MVRRSLGKCLAAARACSKKATLSALEELYAAGSPFIGQVYLHGSSLWSYLLAVIVPEGTTDKALLLAEAAGTEPVVETA